MYTLSKAVSQLDIWHVHPPYIFVCAQWAHLSSIFLSKFQLYNTVLSIILTTWYIRSSDLVHPTSRPWQPLFCFLLPYDFVFLKNIHFLIRVPTNSLFCRLLAKQTLLPEDSAISQAAPSVWSQFCGFRPALQQDWGWGEHVENERGTLLQCTHT